MKLTKLGAYKKKRVGIGLERGIQKLELRRFRKEEQARKGELKAARARAWMEKLLIRVFSGVLYTVFVVGCIFLDKTSTAFAIACMAWLCCSEFFRIVKLADYQPCDVLGLFAAILFPIASLENSYLLLMIIAIVYGMVLALWYLLNPRAGIADVCLSFFGPVYTSLLFSHIVLIRCVTACENPALLTFAVMGSVWLGDVGAYFIGCMFGKHRLCPTISPNKSVEGFFGGLVATYIVWILMYALQLIPISLAYASLCALVVGILSVVGDLFESRLKRAVNIKDSGAIMPGHGGLLDRSDSMLFGCTTAYILLLLGGLI